MVSETQVTDAPAPIDIVAEDVQRRRTSALVPYARNSRSHDQAQVESLAAAIRYYGFTIPILVDERDTIIAGHGRVMAAAKLAMDEVPVIVARGWSKEKIQAYVIWDNRSAEMASWDLPTLRLELADLKLEGFDMKLAGYSPLELNNLIGGISSGQDPDVELSLEIPISELGDVWALGDHRIICGSSTDAATVEALLCGEKPHLMVTDPPYGVEYDPSWRNRVRRSNGLKVGAQATGAVLNDGQDDWREAWALFPGDVAYVWHGSLHTTTVGASLEDTGFALRSNIIWAKNKMLIGRGDYHWKHEPCWYAVRKGRTASWNGARDQTTVWDIPKPQRSETGHSTQKPVECMARPMRNNSKEGDLVYEPFSGSGTTIIAGEMLLRKVRAIELNPGYVDMACRRWSEFTQLAPVLLATGETFADVKARRAPGMGAQAPEGGKALAKPRKRPTPAQTAREPIFCSLVDDVVDQVQCCKNDPCTRRPA
jgi:DNA modification methylase